MCVILLHLSSNCIISTLVFYCLNLRAILDTINTWNETHILRGVHQKLLFEAKKCRAENWTFFQILAHCDMRRRIFNSSCRCQNTISQRGALLIFSICLHFTFPVKLMGFFKNTLSQYILLTTKVLLTYPWKLFSLQIFDVELFS